jgi:hypothetical protein
LFFEIKSNILSFELPDIFRKNSGIVKIKIATFAVQSSVIQLTAKFNVNQNDRNK